MTENYSVLMSVYIKEKPEYLKEAITSILNQTVKTNDFVIVCDGPLTEGLNKVIADFVTTYSGLFNVYRLEHNMGLAKALNNGILQCKNEIIVRMDSDDVSMPDRVEKQMKAMKEKNADIVGSNKKSAVIEAGFYEDYRFFEDYNLWCTMLNKGYKGYNVKENLLYMRGGSEMYKRRGGVSYVRYIYRFRKHLKKIGFISVGNFLTSVLTRSIVSIIPNGLRATLYGKTLRK